MRLATFNLESLGSTRRQGASFEERATVLRPQLERLKADIQNGCRLSSAAIARDVLTSVASVRIFAKKLAVD